MLLTKHRLAWETDGQIVLIADRNNLARFRQLAAARESKRKQASEAIQQVLAKPVTVGKGSLQGIQNKPPAEQIAALNALVKDLSQQTGLSIQVSEAAKQNWTKHPTWFSAKKASVAALLDVLAPGDRRRLANHQ